MIINTSTMKAQIDAKLENGSLGESAANVFNARIELMESDAGRFSNTILDYSDSPTCPLLQTNKEREKEKIREGLLNEAENIIRQSQTAKVTTKEYFNRSSVWIRKINSL